MDRELYVPRSWTSDTDRCRDAGLDQDTAFATKPELATRMITRFLDYDHTSWVTGDEVYGGNAKLRAALEERATGYVLAVACSAEVTTKAGKFRADDLVRKLPKRTWQKLSAGAGAKGHRFYDWAAIDLSRPRPRQPPAAGPPQPQHRRTRLLPLLLTRTGAADHPGAGRWIKVESGRDVPVRKGPGRTGRAPGPPLRILVPLGHLAMLAHAFLAALHADEHTRHPAPDALIPLTCNEIQRLFIALLIRPGHDTAHRLGWSPWRRRHQARSQASHYRRQAAQA